MTESASPTIVQEGSNAGFAIFAEEPASTFEAQSQLEMIGYSRVSVDDAEDLLITINSPDATQPLSVLFVGKIPSARNAFAFQIYPTPQGRSDMTIQHNLMDWREKTNDSFLMVKWEETEAIPPQEP